MSQDGGSEPTQRTVAELLAKYGNGESGERAPRRRRRRDDDMSDTGAQAIIDRVMSESGELPVVRDDMPPPTRTSRRRRADGSRPAERPVERPPEPPPSPPSPPPPSRRAVPPEAPPSPPSRRAVPPVPPPPPPVAKPPQEPPSRRVPVVKEPPQDLPSRRVPVVKEPPQDPPSRRVPAITEPAPPTQPVRTPPPPSRRAVPPVPPPLRQRVQGRPPGEDSGIRQGIGSRLEGAEEPAIRQEATTEEMPRVAKRPTPETINDRLAAPPRRPARPQQESPASRGQLGSVPYAAAGAVPAEQDEDYAGYPDLDPDGGDAYAEPYEQDGYDRGYQTGYADDEDYDEDYEDEGYDEDVDGDLDEDADLDGDLDEDLDESDEAARSPAKEWALMGGQLALGVLGGAAVWLGFNWLWGVLPAAALVVALAVTVGLVLIVRKIRRAEDLQTTVLAVLVGLVVTVSPAALLLLNH